MKSKKFSEALFIMSNQSRSKALKEREGKAASPTVDVHVDFVRKKGY